jgi:ATP-binding cassette subfamily B protein/ATP-binding cassette subfamily C protein
MLRVLLKRKHKFALVVLLFMTILLSIIETFGISIIMPFISVASEPGRLDSGRYNDVFRFLGFTSKDDFILCFGIGIIVFYVLRAAYNVFYTYIQNRFALGSFRHLANNLYKKNLAIPYKLFVQKNISELQNGIGHIQNVSMMLLCILQICSDSITLLMLYAFMLIVNWGMTLLLTAVLMFLIMIIVKIILKHSKMQGVRASEGQRNINRVQNESYNNFKFLRIRGVEDYYAKQFDTATLAVSKAQVVSTTLGSMPRNLLESIGFSLLVGAVLLILFRYGSAESIIPVIAMYALGLYRILPSINRMLSNVNQAAYLQHSLDIVFEHSTRETIHEGSAPITFNKKITFDNVSFNYLGGPIVLHDISFTVNKGEKLAVTGPSGGGKSTLADLFTGVLSPLSGAILVDGIELNGGNIRAWRQKIGYIPQNIYLFDSSVAENVVFGSDYDEKRLIWALETANIWDFLRQNDGLQTRAGEGGIQLSGGQKQRIGIARALYNDPEILILDEATSALDNETETKIMDEIYSASKDKTLIVIAHRLTTIEKCGRGIYIENGRIVKDYMIKTSEKSL